MATSSSVDFICSGLMLNSAERSALDKLKNYQMYNDKIGGKNLHDKYSIDQAMSQRRLAYNSLEEDFAENERL